MTAMNETSATSTITLPEYHNLLALLLLSINTPSVSSSSTTQEEELKKKERRDNAHTEPGARQQNRASRQASYLEKETDLTHKTRYQKERSVTSKKKNRQNQSTTSEHTNTNHTPERRITPQRDKKKKEKPHDTFPPHQPQHPATPADTQTSIQSLPHTSFLHPCHHLFLHPTHILSTHLLTFAHTPTLTVPPPCLQPCTQLYPCLSRSRYRSPSTCVPLPDGRYVTACLATTARLYRLLSHCCLHAVHMSVCTTALACCCLGFSPCAHHLYHPHLCVSPRSPALPPVPYASPLSLPAAYTTLTAR